MMPNIDYTKLKKEIMEICKFSVKDFEKGSNKVAIDLNFEIGKRITRILDSADVKYGLKIVVRLSKDLNSDFGKGFSARHIRHAKKFYTCYRSEKIDYGLSWTHYRLLLSIPEKSERKAFEKRALSGGCSHRELQERIPSERGKKNL